ncbi:ABC transporter permease [Paludisphaera borealis]|uniref:Autoinducer 2 import system permease protein LsrD n=1 Tax=Paludisphaera borealis TaxID=1387353 RepID=A0A1U7CW55_9BACT|nr:ABC transporter permease [Paludisphaera borealis]APW63128.1 Ribose transport system permease protein RbsC [Paludisphaera borealis]
MPSQLRPLLTRLPQILLISAALVLMLRTDRFFTPGTLASILTQASIVGVLAIGQTFVLIGGGFDLSQGAMLALTAAVVAHLAQWTGSGPACMAAALAVGLALGALNGFFVAVVRTNPFVTTLSSLLIYRGAAFIALGGQPFANIRVFQAIDAGFKIKMRMGDTYLPYRGLIFLVVTLLAWITLRRSVFGQHIYALGGNAEAARLAGVRTVRLRVATFALSGLATGVATVLYLSWVRVSKADTGTGFEFDSIAACVVGGVSLQGGRGSVVGAAAGCLLLQALRTQITMSGFPEEYRTLVTGLVILTFAAADALARRSERA